jgi:copper(I)-binding protein
MQRKLIFLVSFIGIILCTASCSIGGKPEIKVKAVKLVSSAVNKSSASAFMLIINDGNGGDVLTACSLKEFPSTRCELHDIMDGKMKKVKEIRIPPEEITVLKKGGLHLMFFDLPEEVDNEITLVLSFEDTGIKEIKTSFKHLDSSPN